MYFWSHQGWRDQSEPSGPVWWFSNAKAIRIARDACCHQHLLSPGIVIQQIWGWGVQTGAGWFFCNPWGVQCAAMLGDHSSSPLILQRGEIGGPGRRQDLQTSGRTRMRTWAFWLLALCSSYDSGCLQHQERSPEEYSTPSPTPLGGQGPKPRHSSSAKLRNVPERGGVGELLD